jgi:Cof subfamily protein (haloacid dehalogenase superfamily)
MKKKFEGRLILTDLDGTLLQADKSVAPEDREAIEYFKSEGGRISFVSGRSPMALGPVCRQVTPNAPVGCNNCATVYDWEKRSVLWSASAPVEALKRIARAALELHPKTGLELFAVDRIYFINHNSYTETHRKDEELEYNSFEIDELNVPLMKCLLADSCEVLEDMARRLPEFDTEGNFDFVRTDHYYFEVMPRGISKALAVDRIPDILGIPRENVIAVGDNDNDAPMLRAAGIGIAVANASQAAKSAADLVTVANTDYALAHIISEL